MDDLGEGSNDKQLDRYSLLQDEHHKDELSLEWESIV